MENTIYSPPKSDLQQETIKTYITASRWHRFLASLIDMATFIPIAIPLMYFTGGPDVFTGETPPSIYQTLVLSISSTVIFLLLHGKIIIRDGQTWGKKALNIKVITIDDKHANLKVLVKRYGVYWSISYIPVIGELLNFVNIIFIFTKSKRCLHDHIAGTQVVNVSQHIQ